MALVQWHSLPPPSEGEVEVEPFRFENQNPNAIAYDNPLNHSLLGRFISHLNCILFVIEDYTWRELEPRWKRDDPLPRNKNELFVKVATWGELWQLSMDSNFDWNEHNPKIQGPDCRGRPASMYTLRHVNYAAGLAKDPIHNWGLIEEDTGLIGMDGRRLPPYVSWACCGRTYDPVNPDKNGCWIHTKKYEVIPYNVAPKFTSDIWEQYYTNPRSDTIEQTWEGVDEIQKGTMWLPKEHYESLHQQISSLKMKMLPIIKKMFANEYREMQDTNGNHFLDPYETLTPDELTTWNQFISLIKEYNKIQCISPSWDLLHVATGTMTWTKEKFEGILMADGSRYVVFKDKKFTTFDELNKEIEDFLNNVFDDIANPDDDLGDSLDKIVSTLAKIDILNDSVIRSQGSLNTLRGEKEDLKNQKFKDFFSEKVSKLQQVEPISVDNVASQLKVDITKQSHEDIDTLKQTLDDEIVTKDKNNKVLFTQITGIRDYTLEPLKEIESKPVGDLITEIGDSLLVIPKNPATLFQEPLGPESRQQKEQYEELVKKVTPDEEFLQVWLANLRVGNIDEPWLQTRINALGKAQEELNKFLGEPTKKLQEKETTRRASEREKTEINDVITKSSAIEFSSAKKILLDHLAFETKQKLTKVLSDAKLSEPDKDLVQILLGRIQNVLENVPDKNGLKQSTLDNLDKQLDAELLQILLERIENQAQENALKNMDPLSGIDAPLLQKLVNVSKLSKDELKKFNNSMRVKGAIWLQRLAIENGVIIDENFVKNLYKEYENNLQKTIEDFNKEYPEEVRDNFVSERLTNDIHKQRPKIVSNEKIFYRESLKGWKKKIDTPDDNFEYLYVKNSYMKELFNNWKWLYVASKMFQLSDEFFQSQLQDLPGATIVDPEKIELSFEKKDITPTTADRVPIKQGAKRILSTSAFKWEKNSCWIDSVFTALFALPEMPIETAIRNTDKVNVPALTLVKGSQTESLGSKCKKWQEFHDLVMEDIQFLQKDGPLVPETCKSITMFNDCVEKPQKYGDPNYELDTLTNLIKFYNLKQEIISRYPNTVDSDVIYDFVGTKDFTFLDIRTTTNEYILFACILDRGGHYACIVREPLEPNGWYFYDKDYVLPLKNMDANNFPAIITGSELFYTIDTDEEKKYLDINEFEFSKNYDPSVVIQNVVKYAPSIIFYVKKSIWEGLQQEKVQETTKLPSSEFVKRFAYEEIKDTETKVFEIFIAEAKTLINNHRNALNEKVQYVNNRESNLFMQNLSDYTKEISEILEKRTARFVTQQNYLVQLRKDLTKSFDVSLVKEFRSKLVWENSTVLNNLKAEIEELIQKNNPRWKVFGDLETFNKQYFKSPIVIQLEDENTARLVGLINYNGERVTSLSIVENTPNTLWLGNMTEEQRNALAYALDIFKKNPKDVFNIMKAMQMARIPRGPSDTTKKIKDSLVSLGLDKVFPVVPRENVNDFVWALEKIQDQSNPSDFMKAARILQHARK